MKTTMTILRAGLVGLFLMTTLGALGQTDVGTIERPPVNVGPINTDHEDTERGAILTTDVPTFDAAYEEINAVLFYNGQTSTGPGLTLVASRTEDLTGLTPTPTRPAGSFTHYQWFYMGKDGTAEAAGTDFNSNLEITGHLVKYEDGDENKLTLTNLGEGYHYFKVRGIVNPNDIENFEGCDTQDEVFVVFVLPQLQVDATSDSEFSNGIDPVFQFCETEGQEGNQNSVSIESAYQFFNNSLPTNTPLAEEFEVKYRYYAIPASTDGTTIDDAAIDPTNYGELLDEGTTTGSPLDEFFPQIATVGQYKILVEIEYVLKDRNYNSTDETSGRVRPYVIYRNIAQATTSTGTDDLIITVTPKPGKPHITIEDVMD